MIERAPPVWPVQESGVDVLFHNALDPEMRARINAAQEAMARDIGVSMYGDSVPMKPPTWKWRINEFRWRVHDAWLVLIGKADIC